MLTCSFIPIPLGGILILRHGRTAAQDGGQPASIVSILVDDEAH